jgi:hypothetical protein
MSDYDCSYNYKTQQFNIYSVTQEFWLGAVNLKTREIEWFSDTSKETRQEIREFLGLLGCVVIDRS